MYNDEVWKPIPMLNGFYEASSLGRIRRAVPGTRTRVGRILKCQLRPSTTRSGGYRIFTPTLGHRSTLRTVSVAEAVLDAFVGPRQPGYEPDHIDGDALNDKLTNLRWLWWQDNRPGRPKKAA